MRGDLHVIGVGAMGGDAIDRTASDAHLRPAAAAMRARTAAAIVVHHDARPDLRSALVDIAPDRCHHPARLVPGNDRAREPAEPKRGGFSAGGAIEFEIAAAHARRFDFDHHVMRPGRGIGKFGDFQFASAKKTHPAHRILPEMLRGISHASAGAGNRCRSVGRP